MESIEEKPSGALNKLAAREETEIDLVEVFYLFLGHIWQLILCMIVGGGLAFAWSYFLQTPVYQSSSKIYVVSASNNSVVNLTDLQIGNAVKTDYMELILSRPVLEPVIENLALNQSVDQLRNMIQITNKSDTRILQITVTCTSPELAMDIANEVATQAIIILPTIMENEPPNLVESALYPMAPSGPNYTKNTLMGAILGFVLCAGVILVIYLTDRSFKSSEDLQKYFGIMPLATVPEVTKKDLKAEEKKASSKRGSRKKSADRRE